MSRLEQYRASCQALSGAAVCVATSPCVVLAKWDLHASHLIDQQQSFTHSIALDVLTVCSSQYLFSSLPYFPNCALQLSACSHWPTHCCPQKFLIFGKSGWIGGLLGEILKEAGTDFEYASARLEDRAAVIADLDRVPLSPNSAPLEGRLGSFSRSLHDSRVACARHKPSSRVSACTCMCACFHSYPLAPFTAGGGMGGGAGQRGLPVGLQIQHLMVQAG